MACMPNRSPSVLKLALWYQEMARNLARFREAVDDICVGQISGAVGTFAQISPKVEAYVCRKAGLKPALVSNQIIQRDRHAYYFATLAIIASSLEKFAVEVRHLQRTEVQEAEEPFTAGPKRLLGDAAQAQSDSVRKRFRPGAADALLRAGRHGKRAALA